MPQLRVSSRLCLIPVLLLLSGCFQWRYTDRKLGKELDRYVRVPHTIGYQTYGDRSLRYVTVGDDETKPLVVFIHGAPGSGKTYDAFLQDVAFAGQVRMLAVDRLGYGNSGFGDPETSLEMQAASLESVIRLFKKGQPLILVGHSYGGPIASLIAAKYPDLCEGVVLLAPAIDPENEKMFWFSYLGKVPPTRWFTPKALKVATAEKFTHEAELRKILPYWEQIADPVTYLHGDADRIVPYVNMKFIEEVITNAPLRMLTLPGEDHGLPYTQVPVIQEEILKLLGR